VENKVPLVIAVIADIARHRRHRVMALRTLWRCGAERQIEGEPDSRAEPAATGAGRCEVEKNV
jgi:hypothetical protein